MKCICVIDYISLVCPRSVKLYDETVCNITLSVPEPTNSMTHSVSVNVSGVIKTVEFSGNKGEIKFELESLGYLEVKATEKHYNTTSSKMIEVLSSEFI